MKMKLLKIQVQGLKQFKDELTIDFYAKQRVNPDNSDGLSHQFSNIYTNNVLSLVGLNASGKTTTLKVISFALGLIKGKAINHMSSRDILMNMAEDDEVSFQIYFLNKNKNITKLQTTIKAKAHKLRLQSDKSNDFYISEEHIFTKKQSIIRSKNSVFDFAKIPAEKIQRIDYPGLLDDVSLIMINNKLSEDNIVFVDTLFSTDFNYVYPFAVPKTLLQYLDPSIEYLSYSEEKDDGTYNKYSLKFYKEKEIICHDYEELRRYLSSGTVKGMNIFMLALYVIKTGGYLVIDEIENHFNKEIISTLIRFFMDSKMNALGATIIYSTHYIELLDMLDRNDSILLLKNKDGITAENYSDLITRNDLKKSDVFLSSYLKDTAPSYDSYMALKKDFQKEIETDGINWYEK